MPKIRVTKHGGFKYGTGAARKQYGKGDQLVVKQKDARTLVAAKLAEVVEDAPVKTRPKARTATAKKPAGRYSRRDMRAK